MIPVYIQPPNKPDRAIHVGQVTEKAGKSDVLHVANVATERVVATRKFGDRHDNVRWVVVAI